MTRGILVLAMVLLPFEAVAHPVHPFACSVNRRAPTGPTILSDVCTVPRGRLLVIEHVNGSGTGEEPAFVVLRVTTARETRSFYYPVVAHPLNVWTVSQTVVLYADAGSTVEFSMSSRGSGPASFALSVSGRLE